MDLFLIGKSRKDFIANKSAERKKELGHIDSKLRILQKSLLIEKDKPETGIDWKFLLNEMKFYLYLVSWLNIGGWRILMWSSRKSYSMSTRLIKYITISQKVHFLLFNIVSIDVAFIGTRTLLQVQKTLGNFWLILFTTLIYVLMMIDVV